MSNRESTDGDGAQDDSATPHERLGPHYIPRIECEKCGTEHHPDATTLPEQGHCRKCSAFLRRPTEAEDRQFTDFLVWNMRHSERGGETVAQ